MRVLLVNKFLYPKGGAETYVLKLGQILESRGHTVQYFGLEDTKNTVGNHAGAYVTSIDFQTGVCKNLTAPFRIIYNSAARRKIRKVLEDFQPDVVHLNNIQFHLTPSIILELQRYRTGNDRKVKIVYTAHDYQLICPNHGLFDNELNVCERCLGGNYTHCLKTKCVKGSYAKSFLGMADAYFWKWSNAYTYVDTIICCSAFLKSKLDSQERFANKTIVIRNFVDHARHYDCQKEGYVLEFGNLSKEKGTLTLLKAANCMPEVKFVFAGYGSVVAEIEKTPNAEYVGFKTGQELEMLIRKAAVSVCPSQWYENCPFSLIESQMYGTPVVGSRMGGIPELIKEGQTGEVFEAGNVEELVDKLRIVLEHAEQYSRQCSEADFETPDSYYDKLMGVYEK
ncbi:MAG: glycosyltransferase family 4 protein [Clostridiales bacterium]|nr:glycosyltransferase family 4 protein [Clostridiales bacterium]